MNFFKTYTNAWKRKNKKLTKVAIADIEITESIHKNLSSDILESLSKQIAEVGDDKEKNMLFVNYHRNTIVVRPIGYGKYALVSGRIGFEAIKMLRIETVFIRVVNVQSREEWMKELIRDYTIRPMISVDDIKLSILKPDQDLIREKIAYLVKNKDFDGPVLLDKKTLDDDKVKIYSGEYNVLAAIALGIKNIRVMVPADGMNFAQ